MGLRKIKINKPELMSSVNICMSGINIRIEYINETENEYVYKWGSIFKFSIDKTIYSHGKINLGAIYKGNVTFFQTELETLKDRNKFLDWTVKNLEGLCLQ